MKIKKWPERKKWRWFFKALNKKEKVIFAFFAVLFFLSFFFIVRSFYFKNTEIKPAFGGTYIEGVIEEPRFINPIYLESDIDKDLTEIIFSGLLKYNENMEIVPDLAERYEIEEDGRVYRFRLKENLVWQNSQPLTAEDVVFTIKTIQNPDYKSHFRPNFLGIEVKTISDLEIEFRLKKPYSSFLENLTIKIMPKHIWQDVTPQKFFSDPHHLYPVGSGPYQIEYWDEDYLILNRNQFYHGKKPFIDKIKFIFFKNEEELIKAARLGKINAMKTGHLIFIKNFDFHNFAFPRYFALFFNPEKSDLLKEKEIRIGLNHALNKEDLMKEMMENNKDLSGDNNHWGEIVDSIIIPSVYKINEPSFVYSFDMEKAEEIFENLGFIREEGDKIRKKIIQKEHAFQFKSDLKIGSKGKEVEELQKCLSKIPEVYTEKEVSSYFGEKTKQAVIAFQEKYREEILEPWGFDKGTGIISKTTREKLNELCFNNSEEIIRLSFTLKTIEHPELLKMAEIIKNQLEEAGVEIIIETVSAQDREQELIRPRNYEMLLLGKVLGALPDFFPFWHSSQKKDPGYNLALYENEASDKLLEEIRETIDAHERAQKIEQLQEIIIEDAPAIFLYTPNYIYATSNIRGIKIKKIADPSKRFINIEERFIKTKRTWN